MALRKLLTLINGIRQELSQSDVPDIPVEYSVSMSDEATALTTGTAKLVFRFPFAMQISEIHAYLTTAGSSGLTTIDVNIGTNTGTILSTKVSIDSGEDTSSTAATPAVISSGTIAKYDKCWLDIDAVGTGAKGLKIDFIGRRI